VELNIRLDHHMIRPVPTLSQFQEGSFNDPSVGNASSTEGALVRQVLKETLSFDSLPLI
jgi:hypothetical protein